MLCLDLQLGRISPLRELTFYLGSLGFPAQDNLIFVSISLLEQPLVDLDRHEIVQENAVFDNPSMYLLSLSV